MKMDIEGFLLASGFTLIVVLIGWSNQITTRGKETREIEQDFLVKAKLKSKEYKKILNKKSSVESSISALVDFLYSKRDEEDIKIFNRITKIKKDLPNLNKKYAHRFWILLITAISLISSGIVSYFFAQQYKIYALAFNLIFVIIMIMNLITTYNLERKYSENISKIMEDL